MLKLVGLAILVAATAAGAVGLPALVRDGHAAVNTTQHVPWGLWVALYIFFLGLSAGSFLLSTLVYVFGVRRLEPAGPLALLQALGCLVLGGALILADLGHPERAYKVLSSWNPTSIMAWMGIFYTLYVAIVAVELYLALRPRLVERGTALSRLLALGSTRLDPAALERDRRWLSRLGLLGIPVAIVVHGGVGAIFAVAKARPGWFSGLFPIVFLVSALASGGALLAFLVAAFSRLTPARKTELVRDLARLTLGLLCLDWLLLGSEVLVTLYGNVPHESIAWRLTLFGPYWWVFWFVQVAIGGLLPAILVLAPPTRSSLAALGLAGFLVVVGVLGARLNLVIPPQIHPTLDGLALAYRHPRWEAGYFPSPTEWQVGLLVAAGGLWAFLAAWKVLPLEERTA